MVSVLVAMMIDLTRLQYHNSRAKATTVLQKPQSGSKILVMAMVMTLCSALSPSTGLGAMLKKRLRSHKVPTLKQAENILRWRAMLQVRLPQIISWINFPTALPLEAVKVYAWRTKNLTTANLVIQNKSSDLRVPLKR